MATMGWHAPERRSGARPERDTPSDWRSEHGSILAIDLVISVDGWAGSAGLPGYFGYLGPELEDWIAGELAAPHVAIMGQRTYELLAGLPEEARDEYWYRMSRQETVAFSRTLR